MADEDIEYLKKQHSAYKGQTSSIKKTFGDGKTCSIGVCESVLHRLRAVYTKYSEVQLKIELLDPSSSDRSLFEEDYGTIEAKILDRIHDLQYSVSGTDVGMAHNSSFSLNNGSSSVEMRLPELKLPTFSGLDVEWLCFRDSFEEMIHKRKMEPILKFHYLINHLRGGKAYSLIEHLPVSAQNYQLAWDTIYKRYNNELSIKRFHTKAIYEIKPTTKNSSSSLQSFINNTVKHYNALKALNVDVPSWDLILVHHLTQQLDNASRITVVKASDAYTQLTFTKFIEILQNRVQLLETLNPYDDSHNNNRQPFRKPSTNVKSANHNNSKASDRSSTFVASPLKCSYCDENHLVVNCPSFLDSKLNAKMRFEFIRSKRLCTNCLVESHSVRDCRHMSCTKCALKHHVLLHFGNDYFKKPNHNNQFSDSKGKQANANIVSGVETSTIAESNTVYGSHSASSNSRQHIVLGTAVIQIEPLNGNKLYARALLDSGSHLNFITLRTCNLLQIKKHPISTQVSGIGGEISSIHHMVILTIVSRTSEFCATIECLVIPKITGHLPLKQFELNLDSLPLNTELADPQFNVPGPIDILIGAELYQDLFSGKSLKVANALPNLYESVLGYVVVGKAESSVSVSMCGIAENTVDSKCEPSLQGLDKIIRKFWEIDSSGFGNMMSLEEKICEEHYKNNTERLPDGRFLVALPVNEKIDNLGVSSEKARNQFLNLERRLIRKPEIYKQYIEFMNEYLSLEHMSVVENPDKITCRYKKSYYIPHHFVLKESSETTKLRVVFNASSKSSSQISLNDCLRVGPTVQQDLFSIVLRFRKHEYAFSADIAKMYRQIRLNEQDQDLQRIWWRNSLASPLKCFKLGTVTYGLASASYLATKTLQQLSKDEQASFPDASKTLIQDFYVDDVLSGSNSLDRAIKLKSELKALLNSGKFELRKFCSNHVQLSEKESPSEVALILGLIWNTKNDHLEISFDRYNLNSKITKRIVLSEICQLFDPLGVCSPIVMIGKLFMQTLWSTPDLKWDEELPDSLSTEWLTFKTELINLNKISIPRFVLLPSHDLIELHGFGDASARGYGCVFYIRSADRNGNCKVSFLCSKSRVAPLKKLTIPRLELCAALLVAQMSKRLQAIMDIQFHSINLWSDSEITLFRINSSPDKFSTFVGTRISQIQDDSSKQDWHYVPSNENPADHVSRGVMPNEFLKIANWYSGPPFLFQHRNDWPEHSVFNLPAEMLSLEVRQHKQQVNISVEELELFSKFSNYQSLINVSAWIRRFIDNCKNKCHVGRRSGPLILVELTETLYWLVRLVQDQGFSTEMKAIREKTYVNNKSSLKTLSPFIDSNNILRVGGRIDKADLPYNQRHPILLPQKHIFSRLVVRREHERLLHVGPQALLYCIRQNYWIINGRSLCRKICHDCIRCSRIRPKRIQQLMGDLPFNRLKQPQRAFTTVGIDFCGPFYVKPMIRSKTTLKVYVCLFICFAVKAAHLEVVHDLSSNAFIACLKRFVARRGLCSNLYSDNATNFVGARRELKEMTNLFLSQQFQADIIKYCNSNSIQWLTIPPHSPHFGGLWEAGVKGAKFHLKRAIGPHIFSIEEFTTLVIQTEACMNSRPITAMSSHPDDYAALSPGHFLIGAPLTALPEPSLLEIKSNNLSRYQTIQCTLQRFWSRWRLEYLSELQQRHKWNRESANVKIGTLVLLHQDNVPPMFWPMGRIVNIHRGEDGKVRVVSVQSKKSVFKRSITKISPLPIVTDEYDIDQPKKN